MDVVAEQNVRLIACRHQGEEHPPERMGHNVGAVVSAGLEVHQNQSLDSMYFA